MLLACKPNRLDKFSKVYVWLSLLYNKRQLLGFKIIKLTLPYFDKIINTPYLKENTWDVKSGKFRSKQIRLPMGKFVYFKLFTSSLAQAMRKQSFIIQYECEQQQH